MPICLFAYLISSGAAAEPFTKGGYIGFGAGIVDFDDDGLDRDVEDEVYGDGLYGAIKSETDDTSIKLFGGYQFSRIVAIELAYIDYGDIVYTHYGDEFTTIGLSSISVAANVGFTFNNGIRVFGLAGLSKLSSEWDVRGSETDDDSVIGLKVGVGFEYQPSKTTPFILRASYEIEEWDEESIYYDEDDYVMAIDTLQLGMRFGF